MMNSLNGINNYQQTKQLDTNGRYYRHQVARPHRECIICGSKAIGINFGAPTCAPCKAFFRRNARRKEILETPCQHSDTNSVEETNVDNNEKAVWYSHIRRCSSCRLHRCFEVGMKEELVRTDEENERHKQLVDINRKRREMIQQQELQASQLSIPQPIVNNNDLLSELDWRHLSNIAYAYDTCCVKTYLSLRANMFTCETFPKEATIEHCILLPMNLGLSAFSYLNALPAFQSLSRSNRLFLCKNNLRRLILVNNHEVNQSCFFEPWQIAARRTTWQFVCGPEIYKQMSHVEELAEKLWIADPIVTRLWIIVLFFSTCLFSCYDTKSSMVKKSPFIAIQNGYVTLLWKYLLNRHGYIESARIYSNLIRVYLNMLRVGLSVHIQHETNKEYGAVQATFDQLITIHINDVQKEKIKGKL